MTGPPPSVAATRSAVRRCLTGPASAAPSRTAPSSAEPGPEPLLAGQLVLVACSGGADSLALAAAAAFVAPRLGLRCGGITIDHGLQPGSAKRAGIVASQLAGLGLDPVRSIAVTVPGGGGPEAAARTARYQALDEAADDTGAAAVLLGHTLDDQAETVLLGLARGSGARSLAGMAPARGRYRRPFLELRRAATQAACAELGLEPWQDPHNADPRYARVRVRLQALPALEAAVGPGVAEALARTASQLRADAAVLDQLAGAQLAGAAGLDVRWLADLPEAIRGRVLRQAALRAGCPAGALSSRHVQAAIDLVTRWHGQRWADLPGGVRVRRHDGRLWFSGHEENGHEEPRSL